MAKKKKGKDKRKPEISDKRKGKISGIIAACSALGASPEDAARTLRELLDISEAEAQRMLSKYTPKKKPEEKMSPVMPQPTAADGATPEEDPWYIAPGAEPYAAVLTLIANRMGSTFIPLINWLYGASFTGDEETSCVTEKATEQLEDGTVSSVLRQSFLTVRPEDEAPRTFEIRYGTGTKDQYFLFAENDPLYQENIWNGGALEPVRLAAVYLHSTKPVPEKLVIRVRRDSEDYKDETNILNMERVTVRQLFEDRFLPLVPFYLFTHGAELARLEGTEDGVRHLLNEAASVASRITSDRSLPVEDRVGLLRLTEAVAVSTLSSESAKNSVAEVMRIAAEACSKQRGTKTGPEAQRPGVL